MLDQIEWEEWDGFSSCVSTQHLLIAWNAAATENIPTFTSQTEIKNILKLSTKMQFVLI